MPTAVLGPKRNLISDQRRGPNYWIRSTRQWVDRLALDTGDFAMANGRRGGKPPDAIPIARRWRRPLRRMPGGCRRRMPSRTTTPDETPLIRCRSFRRQHSLLYVGGTSHVVRCGTAVPVVVSGTVHVFGSCFFVLGRRGVKCPRENRKTPWRGPLLQSCVE